MPSGCFPDRPAALTKPGDHSVSFNGGVEISKLRDGRICLLVQVRLGLALAWLDRVGAIPRRLTTGGSMRPLSILGVALIVLGLVALLAGGFSYTKDKDTADLGPVNITVTDKEHVHVPTPVSVGAIVLGVVLLFAGRRPRTA